MTKVVVTTTMSLDGFIADRSRDVSPLYPDFSALEDNELMEESIESTGAVVMGRGAYEMAGGDFTGYEYQVPIFVLTHQPLDEVAEGESKEGLRFTFVTEGIEDAIERAKAAAGEQDVTVVGGANTAQQCIRAGLFDEIHVNVVPLLLGEGLRDFEDIGNAPVELEQTRLIDSAWAGHSDVTHLRFRVAKET